jgi:hypothetical protein
MIEHRYIDVFRKLRAERDYELDVHMVNFLSEGDENHPATPYVYAGLDYAAAFAAVHGVDELKGLRWAVGGQGNPFDEGEVNAWMDIQSRLNAAIAQQPAGAIPGDDKGREPRQYFRIGVMAFCEYSGVTS